MKTKFNVRKLVGLAMLTGLVIVLQLAGSFIHFGTFSISLVLMPVVLGAAMYGYSAGAWLGFIFGVVVLMSGDAATFYAISPFGTILTVLLKGTIAGFCAGLVYKLVAKKNETLAVALASVVCPLVNTGVFLVGCMVFFLPTVKEWAESWYEVTGRSANLAAYIFLGLVGGNFLFEFGSNLLLNPIIHRLLCIIRKNGERA